MNDKISTLRNQLKVLQALKNEAVKGHDYVLAADLRDQEAELQLLINELNSATNQ